MRIRGVKARHGRPNGLAALFLAFCATGAVFLPGSAAHAALQPGDAAAPLKLSDLRGELRSLDFTTSAPALLVFAKPGDRHTSDVLHAVDDLFQKHPSFKKSLSRWVVLSRLELDRKGAPAEELGASGWPVLLDKTDSAYRAYRIVATPTVVLVGRGGRVEAVNPGYDLGMEGYLRTQIARVTSQSLAPEARKSSKARMYLQMGRRMAARGLWEQALKHYQQAAEEEPLAPEAELELARIHIEMRQLDRAEEILKKWKADPRYEQPAALLMSRVNVLKGPPAKPQPPRVTR